MQSRTLLWQRPYWYPVKKWLKNCYSADHKNLVNWLVTGGRDTSLSLALKDEQSCRNELGMQDVQEFGVKKVIERQTNLRYVFKQSAL